MAKMDEKDSGEITHDLLVLLDDIFEVSDGRNIGEILSVFGLWVSVVSEKLSLNREEMVSLIDEWSSYKILKKKDFH